MNRSRQRRSTSVEKKAVPAGKLYSATKCEGVVGNAKDSGLRTVGVKLRKVNVSATRFDPQVTESDIEQHLIGHFGWDVKVEAINTKYNTFTSFHITRGLCQVVERPKDKHLNRFRLGLICRNIQIYTSM